MQKGERVKWPVDLVNHYRVRFEKPLSLRMTMYKVYTYFFQLLRIAVLLAIVQVPAAVYGQDQPPPEPSKLNTVQPAEQQKTSVSEGNDELKLAHSYEELGIKYKETGMIDKARTNLRKALKSYEVLGLTEDEARVKTVLKEMEEKVELTGFSYDGSTIKSESLKNSTFYNFSVSSNSSFNSTLTKPEIDNNSYFLRETSYKELHDRYDQTAQTHLLNNQPDAAIATYRQAVSSAAYGYGQKVYWWDKIAEVFLQSGKTDSAKTIHERLLLGARKTAQIQVEISQLRQLAGVHFKLGNNGKALEILQQSFHMAQESEDLSEAGKCLADFQSYYERLGDVDRQLRLYREYVQFVRNFAERRRSGLDPESLRIAEEKIEQLESEKLLKDSLIAKTNTFNYFLIGSLGVLLVLLILIFRAWRSIRTQHKRIALQSLRREMNPHFIFNSLNSVNQFIAQNRELEANKYLTAYSNLMRTTMEVSGKDFVLLSREMELLRKYLELELMRFEDKFEFEIITAPHLDPETIFIPNMLIQPHLENAIWHGLRYLDHKGRLVLEFAGTESGMEVRVDDDGIGLTKSAELKTRNQKNYTSVGLKNMRERIELLNALYGMKIHMEIIEKQAPEQGTRIVVRFPLLKTMPQ